MLTENGAAGGERATSSRLELHNVRGLGRCRERAVIINKSSKISLFRD